MHDQPTHCPYTRIHTVSIYRASAPDKLREMDAARENEMFCLYKDCSSGILHFPVDESTYASSWTLSNQSGFKTTGSY